MQEDTIYKRIQSTKIEFKLIQHNEMPNIFLKYRFVIVLKRFVQYKNTSLPYLLFIPFYLSCI